MGRTLHYNFKPKNGKFTSTELEKLYNVGKIHVERCNWTCEEISIYPYDIYPDWDNESGWDKLNARYAELTKQELHPNEISKLLVKEKIACFHRKGPTTGFYGFTKTGGNELNSLQVVVALIAASTVVKNAIITLRDEGKLLLCPIIIHKGLALPNKDCIMERLSYLLSTALFNEDYAAYREDFIAKSKALYDITEKYADSIFNEEPNQSIDKFLRPIVADDFKDYPEYNTAQIMAGFDGEYFGLSKKDAEAESYRMCASIQKLLPDNVKMEVAPKITKS